MRLGGQCAAHRSKAARIEYIDPDWLITPHHDDVISRIPNISLPKIPQSQLNHRTRHPNSSLPHHTDFLSSDHGSVCRISSTFCVLRVGTLGCLFVMLSYLTVNNAVSFHRVLLSPELGRSLRCFVGTLRKSGFICRWGFDPQWVLIFNIEL